MTMNEISVGFTPKPKAGSGGERYTVEPKSVLAWCRLAARGENVLLPPPVGAVRTADVQRRNIACAHMS